MFNFAIKLILISLLIFTPIFFGSIELWAFSLIELGILVILILWAIQSLIRRTPRSSTERFQTVPYETQNSKFTTMMILIFLLLVLFQMISLPSGILRIISPKAYEIRQSLSFEPSASSFGLSFVPFATRIEFLKWLTLSGFFVFLLQWGPSNRNVQSHLILVILLVGIAESLYGMSEFFSGHRHILYLDESFLASTVTGTFINHNYFAGYLLMVIPLSVGYLFSREALQRSRWTGWRNRLSSLDGKTLLFAFGIMVMILGLLFSASRMGILSLLLSFSFMSLLFRNPESGKGFSKTVFLVFGLALLWAVWIGLDAVISRFFTASEDFKLRREIWVNTFNILKDFPLFGSGLGTFAFIFPMYRSFHILGIVTHAENDYLQLASEVGLIGIGILVILFSFLFYKAVSGIRSLRESQKYIGMGGLVGILALMFHSLVERNIQVPGNAFLFTFLLALILTLSTKKSESKNDPSWDFS
jgi:putative inorganic carbon (HCO3(-)) transporter